MNKPTKFQTRVTVTDVSALTQGIVRLEMESPAIATRAQPGQFLGIRAGETESPLLRRPFSIAGSDGKSRLSIVFRVVGVGTRLLASARAGEALDVIGPLGRPFEIHRDRPASLVCGGLGSPPIVFLARRMAQLGMETVLLCGAQTKSELAVLEDAGEHVGKLLVSTDDGSEGHHGFVTDLVEEHMVDNSHLYACGPRPLLDVLIRLVRARNIPAQLSFEQHMACGVGACMGCSIETARGYQRVCTDGPVFPAEYFFEQHPAQS